MRRRDEINDNDCGNDCVLPRSVFVTSQVYDGARMGLDGADILCATLAAEAGLSGSYRAWLSDGAEGPLDRFDTTFTGAYKLVDGQVVASNGWVDLVDGILASPIDLTQEEELIDIVASAWTNTEFDGTSASSEDCMDWSGAGTSIAGNVGSMDYAWTDFVDEQTCVGRFISTVSGTARSGPGELIGTAPGQTRIEESTERRIRGAQRSPSGSAGSARGGRSRPGRRSAGDEALAAAGVVVLDALVDDVVGVDDRADHER